MITNINVSYEEIRILNEALTIMSENTLTKALDTTLDYNKRRYLINKYHDINDLLIKVFDIELCMYNKL